MTDGVSRQGVRSWQEENRFVLLEVTRGYAWECYAAPRRPADDFLYRFSGGLNGTFKEFVMRNAKNFSVGGCVWSERNPYALLFDGRSQVQAVMRVSGASSFTVSRLVEAIDKHTALLNADWQGNGMVREVEHYKVEYTHSRDVVVRFANSGKECLRADKERKTYRLTVSAPEEFTFSLLTMFTTRHLIKLLKPQKKTPDGDGRMVGVMGGKRQKRVAHPKDLQNSESI